MAEGGTVVVDVEPRLDQNRAKKGFSTFAKASAGIFAGIFAAKFALDFGKDLIKQAEEYNSLVSGVGNLVANQQKALGDEATLTTESIVDQAKALQALTGMSDELILSGQRQLLSFQNIQNAGEGTDAIYDRTTRALTDLIASGALTDFNSGAIQLGKALNDPIKGVTALGRAGIQFTDSQKEAIASLVENNDLLGAQKIVLDELEGVYGGTAEAQRDATAVIANAWQDLKVKAGQVLLPIVERVAAFIVDRAIPAFERWWPAIKEVGQAIGSFFAAGWERVQDVIAVVWPILQDVAAWIVNTLIPAFRDKFWPAAVEAWDAVAAAAEEAWEIIEPIFAGIQGLIDEFAGWIDTTLVPALGTMDSESETALSSFAENFQRGWSVVKPILQEWVDRWVGQFKRGEDGMSDFERGAVHISKIVTPVLQQLGRIIIKIFDAVKVAGGLLVTAWGIWGDDIIRLATGTWENLTRIIGGAINVIEGILDVFIGVFTGDWERAWDGVKQIAGGAWDIIIGAIKQAINVIGFQLRALPGKILVWLGDMAVLLYQAGKDLIVGLGRGIRDAAGGLLSTIKNSITSKIPGWIKGPLGISSPSKLTMEFGRNVSEGLAVGIADGASDVQRATDRMIPSIVGAAAAGAASGAPAAGATTEININNPIQRTTNSGIQNGLALGRLMGA